MNKEQLKELVKEYFNLTEQPAVADENPVTVPATEEVVSEENFTTEETVIEETIAENLEEPIMEEPEVEEPEMEEPSMEEVVGEIMALVKVEIDNLKAEIEALKADVMAVKEKYEVISTTPASERTIPTAAPKQAETTGFGKSATELFNQSRFETALAMVNKNK